MADKNLLELPEKTVDLDKVPDLSAGEYENLLYYTNQFDVPERELWADIIKEARGEKTEEATPKKTSKAKKDEAE